MGRQASIGTVAGRAFYVKTLEEDKYGNWDYRGLTTRDGYWVIHEGTKHHVYRVKGEMELNSKRNPSRTKGQFKSWFKF